MNRATCLLGVLLWIACGAAPAEDAGAPRPCGAGTARAGQALVVLQPPAAGLLAAAAGVPADDALGGVAVRVKRLLFEQEDGAQVVLLRTAATDEAETWEQLRRIAADPRVRRVEPDLVLAGMALPDDPLLSFQWGLRQIGMERAWDLPPGREPVRVAVVDSGILRHPDLSRALLPGYDFITQAEVALDGDGRDADATDAGVVPHGTHVAGVIAAAANNSHGVAGVAGLHSGVQVLPLRVLSQDRSGRVQGALSDVLDAIRWAAGLAVPGAPMLDRPAQILNLSLGGEGKSLLLEQVIDQAIAAGVIVVVAAGNAGEDAACFTPAGLPQVITVGATTEQGSRASYSNHGPRVDLLAPGGDGSLAMDGQVIAASSTSGILSTYHSQKSGAFTYSPLVGTSQAAPHVAGALALLRSLGPLRQADAEALLLRTAKQQGAERLLDVEALLRGGAQRASAPPSRGEASAAIGL